VSLPPDEGIIYTTFERRLEKKSGPAISSRLHQWKEKLEWGGASRGKTKKRAKVS